jgi:hypothetical protein
MYSHFILLNIIYRIDVVIQGTTTMPIPAGWRVWRTQQVSPHERGQVEVPDSEMRVAVNANVLTGM